MNDQVIALKITSDGKAAIVDLTAVNQLIDKGSQAAQKSAASFKTEAEARNKANDEIEKSRKAYLDLDNQLTKFLSTNDKAYAAQKKLDEGQDLLRRGLDANIISAKTYETSLKNLTDHYNGLSDGHNKAGVSALFVTREVRALFDELISGRSQQALGTANLLAQRLFGLTPAAMAGLVGVAALGAGLVYLAVESEKSMRALNSIEIALVATNRAGVINRDGIKGWIDDLVLLPGVSKEAATAIVTEFARIPNLTIPQLQSLTGVVGDFAAVTGQDATKAAQQLAKALQSPADGAKRLDEQFNLFSAGELIAIERMVKFGDAASAQEKIIDRLNERIGGLQREGMSQLELKINDVKAAWLSFTKVFADGEFFQDAAAKMPLLFGGLAMLTMKPKIQSGEADSGAAEQLALKQTLDINKGYKDQTDTVKDLIKQRDALVNSYLHASMAGKADAETTAEVERTVRGLNAAIERLDVSQVKRMETAQAAALADAAYLQRNADLSKALIASQLKDNEFYFQQKYVSEQEYLSRRAELNIQQLNQDKAVIDKELEGQQRLMAMTADATNKAIDPGRKEELQKRVNQEVAKYLDLLFKQQGILLKIDDVTRGLDQDTTAMNNRQNEAVRQLNLAYDDYLRKLNQEHDATNFQISLIGKNRTESARLSAENRARLSIEQEIYQLEKKRDVTGMSDAEVAGINNVIAKLNDQKQARIDLAGSDAATLENIRNQADAVKSLDDGFQNMFVHGKDGAKQFAQSLKDDLLKTLYQLTARPFVIQLAGSLTGASQGTISNLMGNQGGGIFNSILGGSGSSGGGLGGYGGLGSMFGGGGAASSGYAAGSDELMIQNAYETQAGIPLTQASGGLMSGAGAALGGAAVGYGVGSVANSVFGNARNKTGMQDGAALGGAIGSIFPVIGTLVGAAIGAALGSLITSGGGPKQGSNSNATYDINGVGTQWGGKFYDVGNKETAGAKGITDALQAQYAATLKALGGTYKGVSFGLGYDVDPQGDAASRVGASSNVNGQTFLQRNESVGRTQAELDAAIKTEGQRAVLFALQASIDNPAVHAALVKINAYTASDTQVAAAIAGALAIKSALDDIKSFSDGASSISAMLKQLRTGVDPTVGTNLGLMLQQLNQARDAFNATVNTSDLTNAVTQAKTLRDLNQQYFAASIQYLQQLQQGIGALKGDAYSFAMSTGQKINAAGGNVDLGAIAGARLSSIKGDYASALSLTDKQSALKDYVSVVDSWLSSRLQEIGSVAAVSNRATQMLNSIQLSGANPASDQARYTLSAGLSYDARTAYKANGSGDNANAYMDALNQQLSLLGQTKQRGSAEYEDQYNAIIAQFKDLAGTKSDAEQSLDVQKQIADLNREANAQALAYYNWAQQQYAQNSNEQLDAVQQQLDQVTGGKDISQVIADQNARALDIAQKSLDVLTRLADAATTAGSATPTVPQAPAARPFAGGSGWAGRWAQPLQDIAEARREQTLS